MNLLSTTYRNPVWRILLIVLIISSCKQSSTEATSTITQLQPENQIPTIDLEKIQSRGKLVALTRNSSSSYFIYKGITLGYEYELLNAYAKDIGVDLEIVLVDNMDSVFSDLNQGKGDIAAANITITGERSQIINFSEPHLYARQVLIQQLPHNWRNLKQHQIEQKLVRNPIQLINKTVHVRKNTSFYSRLINLEDEIGGEINIQIVDGHIETEQLIEQVAKGIIEYTVADENIALLNRTYHPNLDVGTAISFPQKIAWAVRKTSPNLLISINEWIANSRGTSDYATIYNKYFRSSKSQKERVNSAFSSIGGGHICEYDTLIQLYSTKLDWDWRLIASQIFQESQFNAEAESWTGAYGLMQVLPSTAEEMGIINFQNPENNLIAGIKYLKKLDSYWKKHIPNKEERIKFVLASYNVGLGHVLDAKRLSKKYGKNPLKWEDNVAQFLLLKSNEQFFNDEVVKHGYCRGNEPFNYVNDILSRYEHYKNVIS